MGIYLVPELLSDGYDVVVTSRSSRRSDDPRLRYIQGDARDLSFLKETLSSWKPLAVVDFMMYDTAEFSARLDMLLGSTEHYLFLSSYRVFADSSPQPLTERSPRLLDVCDDRIYLASNEYALAKASQENLLRCSGRTNWTILRPCITYSRTRFQFGTLEAGTFCFRALQGLPVIMAREILVKDTTMTWAGDVAKLISRLIFNDAAWAEDFNVVTAEYQPWSEVAKYYREFLDLRVIEVDLAKYIEVVGSEYQIRYDRMYNRRMDNTKVISVTGVRQKDFKSLRDGLEMELVDFCRKPCYSCLNIGVNARMDKVTGSSISLTPLSLSQKASYFLARYRWIRVLSGLRRFNLSTR